MVNLSPTSTGSATAIAEVFPELKGKLNGLAVRVPLTNGSITDCVFEVSKQTTREEASPFPAPARQTSLCTCARVFESLMPCGVHKSRKAPSLEKKIVLPSDQVSRLTPCGCNSQVNAMLKAASESGPLKGFLGFEERPLVSTDFVNDSRSSIVDAECTMVVQVLCLDPTSHTLKQGCLTHPRRRLCHRGP